MGVALSRYYNIDTMGDQFVLCAEKPYKHDSARESLKLLRDKKSEKTITDEKATEIAQKIWNGYNGHYCLICRCLDSLLQLVVTTKRGEVYKLYQEIIKPIPKQETVIPPVNPTPPDTAKENEEAMKNQELFGQAIEDGNVKLIVELIYRRKVDPSVNNNEAIQKASSFGHIKVVKLLLANPRVDPSDANHAAFRNALKNGHLEVADLLNRYRRDISNHGDTSSQVSEMHLSSLDSVLKFLIVYEFRLEELIEKICRSENITEIDKWEFSNAISSYERECDNEVCSFEALQRTAQSLVGKTVYTLRDQDDRISKKIWEKEELEKNITGLIKRGKEMADREDIVDRRSAAKFFAEKSSFDDPGCLMNGYAGIDHFNS